MTNGLLAAQLEIVSKISMLVAMAWRDGNGLLASGFIFKKATLLALISTKMDPSTVRIPGLLIDAFSVSNHSDSSMINRATTDFLVVFCQPISRYYVCFATREGGLE